MRAGYSRPFVRSNLLDAHCSSHNTNPIRTHISSLSRYIFSRTARLELNHFRHLVKGHTFAIFADT
jgi:hypothetical protein